jgi:hypothetical protein
MCGLYVNIRHTPTIADLYLCKARIMKNTGDGQASWQVCIHHCA